MENKIKKWSNRKCFWIGFCYITSTYNGYIALHEHLSIAQSIAQSIAPKRKCYIGTQVGPHTF